MRIQVSLFTVLAVFVVLQGATILLTLFLASRGTGLVLDLFQELDEKLAGAIQKVLESGGLEGVQPVNPLQQAIAQMLIEIAGHAPVSINQLPVRPEQGSEDLAHNRLADALSAAKDHRRARLVPWPLHHLGKPSEEPAEVRLIALADIAQQVIPEDRP